MDAAAVLRRIAAVGGILQATSDPLQIAAVSRAQAGQVVRELKKARLPPEDLQPILEAIAGSRFTECDKAAINTCISQLVSDDGDSASCVADNQDWESLQEFLPQTVWDSLPSGDPNPLFDFLIDLGLRRASEPTKHTMACLLMQAGKGLDGAMRIDSGTRTESVLAVGTLFAERVASVQPPPPVPVIMKLPATPTSLQGHHPALFTRVYSLQPPKRFDLDPVGWSVLKKSTKMRHRSSRPAAPASASMISGLQPALSRPSLPGSPAWPSQQQQQLPPCHDASPAMVAQVVTSMMPSLAPMQSQIQQVLHQVLQQSLTGQSGGTAAIPTLLQAAGAAIQQGAAPAAPAASAALAALAPPPRAEPSALPIAADGPATAAAPAAAASGAAAPPAAAGAAAPPADGPAAAAAPSVDAMAGSKGKLSVEDAAKRIQEAYASQKNERKRAKKEDGDAQEGEPKKAAKKGKPKKAAKAAMRKPSAACTVKLPRLYDESTRCNFLIRFMGLADAQNQNTMSFPYTMKTKQATMNEAFPSEGRGNFAEEDEQQEKGEEVGECREEAGECRVYRDRRMRNRRVYRRAEA